MLRAAVTAFAVLALGAACGQVVCELPTPESVLGSARLAALHATPLPAHATIAELSPAQRTAAATVDREAATLTAISREVFGLAELALSETRSSELLATFAEQHGFAVERGVAQMPTAWVATWSSGTGPTIGVLAEFDALPGLSQVGGSPQREAAIEGGCGHGCGHNLFGVAATAAAIALKEAMSTHGIGGTVKLYGTPAEEQGLGKIYMVRDGLFEGVDVCLSWHPADKNEVDLQPSKACISFETTFHGRSAHASAAPWDGVSALDAVEAFLDGANLLREHMPETARIHYVITDGGKAPNVIPARARVWMYVRGKDWREAEKVYAHVEQCIDGADRMAWGEEHGDAAAGWRAPEVVRLSGLYEYNINFAGSELLQKNLERIGVPGFTAEEQEFARALQRSFGAKQDGYSTTITPFSRDRAPEPGGSTDVANVSWTTPTVELRVATWPKKIPAHSWASTAASGASGGYRAMLVAAKTLAATGLDCMTDAAALAAMRAEFVKSREGFDYSPAVRPTDVPSVPSHMKTTPRGTPSAAGKQ
ncbi:MAG: amidohydrolase [Planctomycetes bacterium]|nr:amidohydrolase [Planctomycetota bacterium]